MTTNKHDASIKRLLLKAAYWIGADCCKYTGYLINKSSGLSDIELEILERIFTMGLYSDNAINSASAVALSKNVSSAYDFNFLVCEINNSMYQKTETE